MKVPPRLTQKIMAKRKSSPWRRLALTRSLQKLGLDMGWLPCAWNRPPLRGRLTSEHFHCTKPVTVRIHWTPIRFSNRYICWCFSGGQPKRKNCYPRLALIIQTTNRFQNWPGTLPRQLQDGRVGPLGQNDSARLVRALFNSPSSAASHWAGSRFSGGHAPCRNAEDRVPRRRVCRRIVSANAPAAW